METIRFRPGWRQLPWYVLLWPGLMALVPGPAAPAGTGRDAGERALVLVALALAFTVEFAWLRQTGAELRPDALVLHGLRRRTIPWHDVDWVGPAPMLGTRCVGVTTGGRTLRLRAPTHTPWLAPDPNFEAKARTIHAWWERQRGPDWTPPPSREWWATSAGSGP